MTTTPTPTPSNRGGAPAATHVYVSNAEDGDISTFTMLDTGALRPGPRIKAGPAVMPMAVSPDRRFLYAASRAQPFTVHVYAIDRDSGALNPVATSPLAASFPYITLDRTGRFLLGASYADNLVSVNAVDPNGRVSADPLQVIPVGRNAHSIRIDATNRFAYVPTLGTDAIFMFAFDEATGRLTSNTPALILTPPLTGPRHFVFSPDNGYLHLVSEFLATVITFSIDGDTGLLTQVDTCSALPADSTLLPGVPRIANSGRNIDHDIWAADIQRTPDGRFVYVSERTSNSISTLEVAPGSGKLTYRASMATERQPRGFAIDATGRYLVATGEKSPTLSVYAIDQANGSLRLLEKYPVGKGANWVEIVSFD